MATSKSTSGFTMENATYARSQSGKNSAISDFDADIENLVKVLNGDKYAAFKKTINNNWVGEDATTFLNEVEKTRKKLQKDLRNSINQMKK